jgi:hypothetical protein
MRTGHEEGADCEAEKRSIEPAYISMSDLLRRSGKRNLHELERDWEPPADLGVPVADEGQSILCMTRSLSAVSFGNRRGRNEPSQYATTWGGGESTSSATRTRVRRRMNNHRPTTPNMLSVNSSAMKNPRER